MEDAVPLMATPSARADTAPDGDGADGLLFTRALIRLIMTAIPNHAKSPFQLTIAR